MADIPQVLATYNALVGAGLTYGFGALNRRHQEKREDRTRWSYPEFLVLRAADGGEHLIRYGPAISFALPAEPPALRPTPGPAVRRYQFALALRELARRREPVRVALVDGTGSTGRSRRSAATILRLPSTIRARRAAGRPCGRAGSWGSPRSLRSVFLRRADERVLARPVGRLLVHALDVALELDAVNPPHPASAELDGGQFAAADQRVDLGGPDVEDRGHVLQRVEPGLDAGCGHAVLLGAVKLQVAGPVSAACDRSSLAFPQ
jgi:hypothetical protein